MLQKDVLQNNHPSVKQSIKRNQNNMTNNINTVERKSKKTKKRQWTEQDLAEQERLFSVSKLKMQQDK
jgi:hypothetical protein